MRSPTDPKKVVADRPIWQLAEHEARELERLRQLETMQSSRQVELDAFKLQAERAIEGTIALAALSKRSLQFTFSQAATPQKPTSRV